MVGLVPGFTSKKGRDGRRRRQPAQRIGLLGAPTTSRLVPACASISEVGGGKELVIPVERIERSILLIRGQKVMLDRDLATLYGVTTKAFNQAVKRNAKRFPDDFMFQLTAEEAEHLRSQFVTSNQGRGGRRYAPYAFTQAEADERQRTRSR